MKVTLKTVYAHPTRGCHQPGRTIDVDDAEGRDLIAGGYAVAAKPDVPAEDAAQATPETARRSPPETASRGRGARAGDRHAKPGRPAAADEAMGDGEG